MKQPRMKELRPLMNDIKNNKFPKTPDLVLSKSEDSIDRLKKESRELIGQLKMK